MHRFNALAKGARRHDRESSDTRYLMNNEKRAKLSFLLLLFCKSFIASTLRLIKICFKFTPCKWLNKARYFCYAGLNVAVPRVTKFYEKNRSKKFFFSEKPFNRVKTFLAQHKWFIFDGILKIKVNKRTNLYL